MIYWYTGQPGHGKSLHAIERAMGFVAAGRVVYACNVKGLDYEKTGMLPMTPEQFIDWPNFLPDGAVCLVDECYQHGMLPKRSPSSKVPPHVDELARHRHRGIDFIFVSQSPSNQCDSFIVDLIEEQVHVRRLFGTKFVRLKVFDRHERNPDKAQPLHTKRHTLNRKSKGLYQSTVLDTSERRIPWYFYLFGAMLIGVPLYGWYTWSRMQERFSGSAVEAAAPTGANGAHAKVATGEPEQPPDLRKSDYVAWMRPRVTGQPWTAPAYDHLEMPRDPPRVFCMTSGSMRGKQWTSESCTCITEQGTRYNMDMHRCSVIAMRGQYEPFIVRRDDMTAMKSGQDQYEKWAHQRAIGVGAGYAAGPSYGADGLGAYETAVPQAR